MKGKRHDPRRQRARAARRRRQSADPGRDDRGGLHGGGDAPADQHRAPARDAGGGDRQPDAREGGPGLCRRRPGRRGALRRGGRARARHRHRPRRGDRGPDAGGDEPAGRRAARGDRRGRGRAARRARRDRARQARRADERRARRHRRPAAEGPRRRGRGDLHQRRRRPAGGAAEPLALREGDRRAPGALRQHQGPAGSLPDPDHPGGLREAVGPAAVDGHLLRRRHQDLASSRRSSPTPPA